MSLCPICDTPMKKERRELRKGIFAWVEVCPKCEEEWIDEKGYEELYEHVKIYQRLKDKDKVYKFEKYFISDYPII
ncbi:hypothetical protein Mtc_0402 [Methanocella conradii HZ254]|uniref:Transcription factor zinc-finger domain-containing protein n=1 Tax=Methanocella conradii (strain DSM 24694 / JCM 17849 / CGMCC 1.5162 / HZ254) TaxID=1041930 RepID=H8I431_METCZ|nr:hypothetical protein [Methanocella conradii]AFC99170.1 hypothetical protein Mtc_0402 [Methanocella conradii HZ254]